MAGEGHLDRIEHPEIHFEVNSPAINETAVPYSRLYSPGSICRIIPGIRVDHGDGSVRRCIEARPIFMRFSGWAF